MWCVLIGLLASHGADAPITAHHAKAGETVFIHMVACHSYKFHFLVLLDLNLVGFFPL